MADKYQDIQLLWTNSLDTPPNPQDLKLGQPLINIRDGVETLYLKNEKGDGLIEFVGKNAIINIIDKIIEKSADEEDITTRKIDGSNKFSFADRKYDPNKFSGFGYKILRKNIFAGKNVLTQDMIDEANTIYEIRYDFDLNGTSITIPDSCVLRFNGGSFSNGQITSKQIIIKDGKFLNCCVRSYQDIDIYGGTYTINTNLQNSRNTCILLEQGNNNSIVRIKNCTITNTAADSTHNVYQLGIKLINNTTNITEIDITNNHVYSNNMGVETQGSTAMFKGLINGNYIEATDNFNIGLSAVGNTDELIISNNTLKGGIYALELLKNTYVTGNIIIGTSDYSIGITSNAEFTSNVKIVGNNIFGSPRFFNTNNIYFENNVSNRFPNMDNANFIYIENNTFDVESRQSVISIVGHDCIVSNNILKTKTLLLNSNYVYSVIFLRNYNQNRHIDNIVITNNKIIIDNIDEVIASGKYNFLYTVEVLYNLGKVIEYNNPVSNYSDLIKGSTEDRPKNNLSMASIYIDNGISLPLIYDGDKWIRFDGTDANIINKGPTSQRPTNAPEGFRYFDTDLEQEIIWDGTQWLNTDGTLVNKVVII